MNNYVTGKIIKELREKKGLTQLELANVIGVSDKASRSPCGSVD